MTVATVLSRDALSKSSSLGGNVARNYEVVSTRPLPVVEIPVTVTLRYFGAAANEKLVNWYTARRTFLTRLSNAARLMAVTSWFLPLPISRGLMLPLLLCGLPKLVSTLLLLSTPILHMLTGQYEFWFTTVLNFIGMVLFAIQIGPDLRLGYPLLTFMSIQVTICSDADVYTLSETARAGVLSSVCAIALGVFALHRGVFFKTQPDSAYRDWNLAEVNFMANVSMTLAIFIINKSYKRRRVFWPHRAAFVPLAVCRAKLSVRSRRGLLRGPTLPRNGMSEHDQEDAQISSVGSNTTRRRSSILSIERMQFHVVSASCKVVDANRALVPWLCLQRPLTDREFFVLACCGVCGVLAAVSSLTLIGIFDVRDHRVLYPMAVASLSLTTSFCVVHAVHYQRDLVRLLVHNFDFWFTSMQFTFATLCLADLLQWDYRCLNIVSWWLWFHWVLFTDAMLPTHKRKLHFKKRHATPVLVAVLVDIVVLAYLLAFDRRHILHTRVIDMGTFANFLTMVISTDTFLGYRLATLWLWSVRLVTRLGFRAEEELVLLRGGIEYRNPFFRTGSTGASRVSQPRHSPPPPHPLPALEH